MKKKHLQIKQLKLQKETIVNMSTVTGGAPRTAACPIEETINCPVLTADRNCDTQGTVMPCCPGCRSGANATVADRYCTIIANTIDCPIEPADPIG